MKFLGQIIKGFCVTEKATAMVERNCYVFKVASDANRIEIRKAIELAFGVNVTRVNVLNKRRQKKQSRNNPKKVGYVAGYKQAMVTVKAGEKIDIV